MVGSNKGSFIATISCGSGRMGHKHRLEICAIPGVPLGSRKAVPLAERSRDRSLGERSGGVGDTERRLRYVCPRTKEELIAPVRIPSGYRPPFKVVKVE